MKLSIHKLLFMCAGFITCVYGESYLNSIYDSVVGSQELLKDVASSVGKGLVSLGKGIKFVEKFVDSTIEEDCIYKCRSPNDITVPNPNHVSDFNGCGSLGLNLSEEDLPKVEMVDCCNTHDKCYDTCNSNKEECDKLFKRCLYRTCLNDKERNPVQYKVCQAGAKLLYTTTLALGCTSYKESQRKACLCVIKSKTSNSRNEL